MCGIIISNKEIKNLNKVNKFCKNRGPDKTSVTNYNGFHFVHNLLHNTGDFLEQPIYNNNCLIIFNGEIYNDKELYKQSKSDIGCIIPTYLKYGENFVSKLDGDFCLILFDFNNKKLFISSDTFATKPLFYNISKENTIISSYESCCLLINNNLKYNAIKPNQCLIFSLDTYLLEKNIKITEFDLNQYKDTYDDWNKAFEEAVLKRIPNNTIPLICLSSGMDSGAISCCIEKHNINFYPLSIKKNENIEVLNKRKEIHKNLEFISLSEQKKIYWKHYLKENCEPCFWDWRYNPRVRTYVDAFNMGSMLGNSEIMNHIKKKDENCRVMLTGIGADEVMARNFFYSCGFGQVDIFPENLENVFPWINFFNGSEENYIRGQEYVGGCFNFETRYPFLDKKVIQEFLWLKPELKNGKNNNIVKPVLINYLNKNNYPYHLNKLGFNV